MDHEVAAALRWLLRVMNRDRGEVVIASLYYTLQNRAPSVVSSGAVHHGVLSKLNADVCVVCSRRT